MTDPGPVVVQIGESLETFYAREYRPLVALTYVLSGSRSVAEDLAQDAMASTYRQWSRVSVMDSPTGYLRRTAANLAASGVRRKVAEAKALLRLSSQRTLLPEIDEPDEQFWAAVRRLPTRQAQAVALRYVYDCPVAEVARVMRISEGAVKAHLSRGRQTLSQALGLMADPTTAGEVAS
jgi:RNA polymerase sigma-70 factor (ECF subfamily)